ncbi:MAG: type II 3-dehydroquinate dehydratase [Pseudomonadota bacterium]
MSMVKVLVLNGPNLNLLGEREPGIYGATSLADVEAGCVVLGRELGLEVRCRQSNHEGELIDAVHEARADHGGLIVNAGGYSHTSIALADSLRAFPGRIAEVHVTNIHRREAFRHHSHVALVADAVLCGCGPLGYELALRYLAAQLVP